MDDSSLARVSEICLGLPEAEREDAGRHAGFRVRGRTFAWYMDDHHGDGAVGVTLKAPAGESDALLAADPERFYRPAYTRAGWVGVRLDRGGVDWDQVEGLLTGSYVLVAPKRLGALLRVDVD